MFTSAPFKNLSYSLFMIFSGNKCRVSTAAIFNILSGKIVISSLDILKQCTMIFFLKRTIYFGLIVTDRRVKSLFAKPAVYHSGGNFKFPCGGLFPQLTVKRITITGKNHQLIFRCTCILERKTETFRAQRSYQKKAAFGGALICSSSNRSRN